MDGIITVRSSAPALKAQGFGRGRKGISDELKGKHPDWADANAVQLVSLVYQDPAAP